jgi:hypothetical protein
VVEQGGHLAGWQLMVEGFNPRNPPVLLTATETERKLYERIAAFSREVIQHTDDGQEQGGEKWLGQGRLRRRASDK